MERRTNGSSDGQSVERIIGGSIVVESRGEGESTVRNKHYILNSINLAAVGKCMHFHLVEEESTAMVVFLHKLEFAFFFGVCDDLW
jgi:hypothetical protein